MLSELGAIVLLMFLAGFVAEFFIMWGAISRIGFAGSLWRVSALYAISKIIETAGYYAVIAAALSFGWAPGWSSSTMETVVPVILCLGAGIIPKIIIAKPMYKAAEVSWSGITILIIVSSLCGYLAALWVGTVIVNNYVY